ncbi:DUF1992 domain-containing protein [Caenimonas koreensis DSM 17982]|uniref:DUF1992 domain-containing protein n=1 Tax=Caenimonas koreensis DSM 17982 TaxID=1121255 RepID=A0A844ATW9_9BURK|nr:DUF1992 domain-containing protein [Caenimonas koreensis]MRD47554.1 DUF1992 domain-containing protein [Caenimonas koreensis DSM 17982]
MPTQDEEIARHLREAAESGEMQRIAGYGKPLPEDAGWDATPDEFRMPFKILKNAGYAPPEVEMFRQRAELAAQIEASTSESDKIEMQRKLADLQQKIALRLEALRVNKSL